MLKGAAQSGEVLEFISSLCSSFTKNFYISDVLLNLLNILRKEEYIMI